MSWCLEPPEDCFFPYRFPACPSHCAETLHQLKCLWQPCGRTAPWCLQMGRSEAPRLGTRCWRQMYRVESLPGSQEQPTRHSVSRRNSCKMHHPGKVNRAKQCLPSSGLQYLKLYVNNNGPKLGKQLQALWCSGIYFSSFFPEPHCHCPVSDTQSICFAIYFSVSSHVT